MLNPHHLFENNCRDALITRIILMPLFKLSETSLNEVEKTSYKQEAIRENVLREAIRKNSAVLGEALLILSEEYSNWEDSDRRIDLLALDRSGNLVVVELKRTEDGGHAELQSVRYAAMVNSMTFDDVVAAFQTHLKKTGRPDEALSAEQTIREFVTQPIDAEAEEVSATVLSGEVRIILLAAEFSREITASVLWLRDHEIDIRCLRSVPYKNGTELLVHVDTVLPMPEARDYLVRVAAKQEQIREAKAQAAARYVLTEDGKSVEVSSRKRLFWEVVSRLCKKGVTSESLVAQCGYSQMFLSFPRDTDEESVRQAILQARPDDKQALDRYDRYPSQWIVSANKVYVLRNQGSAQYLPKLADLASKCGISWKPV
jgi:hypothetical protein